MTRRCHTKAVITKPQNVYVMRDISCNGYVAGCNTKWFAKKNGAFSAENVKQNMADRLAFAEGEDSFGSMLAFPMMGDGFEQHDQVVSISNRLMPWEVQKKDDNGFDIKKYFPGGSTAWNVYKKAYNLPAIHFGEDIKAAQGQEFISQV